MHKYFVGGLTALALLSTPLSATGDAEGADEGLLGTITPPRFTRGQKIAIGVAAGVGTVLSMGLIAGVAVPVTLWALTPATGLTNHNGAGFGALGNASDLFPSVNLTDVTNGTDAAFALNATQMDEGDWDDIINGTNGTQMFRIEDFSDEDGSGDSGEVIDLTAASEEPETVTNATTAFEATNTTLSSEPEVHLNATEAPLVNSTAAVLDEETITDLLENTIDVDDKGNTTIFGHSECQPDDQRRVCRSGRGVDNEEAQEAPDPAPKAEGLLNTGFGTVEFSETTTNAPKNSIYFSRQIGPLAG